MPYQGVNHVHFNIAAANEEATVDFYTDVVGMDLVRKLVLHDRHALFFSDETYARLFFFVYDGDEFDLVPFEQNYAFVESEGDVEEDRETPIRLGFHHLAFGLDSPDEVDAVGDLLAEKGVETWGPHNRSNFSYSLYFEDPNGFLLHVHAPQDPARLHGAGVWEDRTREAPTERGEKAGVELVEPGVVREAGADSIASRFRGSFWGFTSPPDARG